MAKRMNDFTSHINGLPGSTTMSPMTEQHINRIPSSRMIQNKMSKNQLTSLELQQVGYMKFMDDNFNPEKLPKNKRMTHLHSSFEGAGALFSAKKTKAIRSNHSTGRKSYNNKDSLLPERDEFLSNSCRDSLLSAAQIGLSDVTKVSCSRSMSGRKGEGTFKAKLGIFTS